MNLIIVGCEYAGKTTLANEIVEWTNRTMGGGRTFHDHFSIPSPELTPEGQEQMLAASVEIKEMFQRYMIQYHMNHSFYSDSDHNMVGFHIENYIYGELYYGFDTAYQDRVFAHEERELMREAPHSILLLLKASPEVIRQRMKDNPHEYQVVQDGDVEDRAGALRGAFRAPRPSAGSSRWTPPPPPSRRRWPSSKRRSRST